MLLGMLRSVSFLALILSAFAHSSLVAENWPAWRGPTANGLSGVMVVVVGSKCVRDDARSALLLGRNGRRSDHRNEEQ